MTSIETAEEFFTEAWDVEEKDRDFTNNDEAMDIYGEEPNNVAHFIFPEKTDDQGRAYVYQSIPITLFANKFRRELEDTDISELERLRIARENAESVKDDIILAETREKLIDDEKI